jgi:hypothetical protein
VLAVFLNVLPNVRGEVAVGLGAVRAVVVGLVGAVGSYLTLDRDSAQMFGKSHNVHRTRRAVAADTAAVTS